MSVIERARASLFGLFVFHGMIFRGSYVLVSWSLVELLLVRNTDKQFGAQRVERLRGPSQPSDWSIDRCEIDGNSDQNDEGCDTHLHWRLVPGTYHQETADE